MARVLHMHSVAPAGLVEQTEEVARKSAAKLIIELFDVIGDDGR